MKKLPPWGWALIAVGVGAAAWLYKKSKETEKLKEEGSSNESVVAGVEPEEYPYSIAGLGGGGGGGLGGPISNAGEQGEFLEFQRQFSTEQREQSKSVLEAIRASNEAAREQFQELLHAGGGGGPPSSPSPGGTTAPPPATAGPSCPASYPLHNSANGPPSPHSCYRYSRDKCKSKTNPYNHAYQDGHHVCSPS